MIRVTVIVPALDAEATLPRTLAALADQEGAPSFEVVVADLGSTDGTAAIAVRAGARVVRGSANAALATASGALVALCGADSVPVPGWLAAGTRALTEADLVQGRVLSDTRAEPGPFDHTHEVSGATGLHSVTGLFATRTLFDRLERASVAGEEVWLAPPGVRTAYCPQALCHRPATPRSVPQYLEARTRLREVPAAVARAPELRGTLLHRRLFLSRRALNLDAALAGLATAAARRSTLPLLAALPYLLEVRRHARERGGEDWKRVAAVDAAADVLGAAALLHGSVEARTLVL